jgi:hypothetical protein
MDVPTRQRSILQYTLVYEQDAVKGPLIYTVAHRAPGYWLERV